MPEEPIQRTLSEVRQMSDAEYVHARQAGELRELAAGRDPGQWADVAPLDESAPPVDDADQGARTSPSIGQVTLLELRRMTPVQRVQARKEGRLTSLGVGR